MKIRNNELVRDKLNGMGHFLEGLGQYRLNQPDLATETFAKVSSAGIDDPLLAFKVASQLNEMGQGKVAQDILRKFEGTFTNRGDFYFQLVSSAYATRQLDLLVPAAEKAYQIEPNNIDYIHNYAASLLVTRQRPELAIQLTLRVFNERHGSIDAQINHALALVQNARLDEAENMLQVLRVLTLSPAEQSSIHLGWFELMVQRGKVREARQAYAEINKTLLLEIQSKWLEETLTKLPRG